MLLELTALAMINIRLEYMISCLAVRVCAVGLLKKYGLSQHS